MRQILDMYRMTKQVQKIIDSFDRHLTNTPHQRQGDFIISPAAGTVKEDFRAKYKKISYFKANAICNDAIEHGYLKPGTTPDLHGGQIDGVTEVDNLSVTTKGRSLLDSFGGIPWGLLKAWIEEYGAMRSALFSMGLGILIRELFALGNIVIKALL